jgi:hypothetical protein
MQPNLETRTLNRAFRAEQRSVRDSISQQVDRAPRACFETSTFDFHLVALAATINVSRQHYG